MNRQQIGAFMKAGPVHEEAWAIVRALNSGDAWVNAAVWSRIYGMLERMPDYPVEVTFEHSATCPCLAGMDENTPRDVLRAGTERPAGPGGTQGPLDIPKPAESRTAPDSWKWLGMQR